MSFIITKIDVGSTLLWFDVLGFIDVGLITVNTSIRVARAIGQIVKTHVSPIQWEAIKEQVEAAAADIEKEEHSKAVSSRAIFLSMNKRERLF